MINESTTGRGLVPLIARGRKLRRQRRDAEVGQLRDQLQAQAETIRAQRVLIEALRYRATVLEDQCEKWRRLAKERRSEIRDLQRLIHPSGRKS